MADLLQPLMEEIRSCVETGRGIRIAAGGSKGFLGERQPADLHELDVSGHQGVISYEPKELVLRARAGTPLAELRQLLASEGQLLGFEPPDFGEPATLGGAVAAGTSGPRRPWAGAVRDFVLGAGLITGQGEHLKFGGQVMKNVAGFDVSRLLCGAMGTLGVITDVSLKVLPAPKAETTLVREMSVADAHRAMIAVSNTAMPVSATCYANGRLSVRLSGSEAGVKVAAEKLGGDIVGNEFWDEVANLRIEALAVATRLWRLSVPRTSTALLGESQVIEWGGALRWLADPQADPRQALDEGHATLYRAPKEDQVPRFTPLTGVLLRLHHRLKQTFDPAGIMNPGRLYRDL